jgi:undecaprenyl-diphosphatase
MLEELFLAFVQAATEYLPVSSSGHLALFSNLISKPNIFFFTVLHVASLIAILIFTRKEVVGLLSFRKSYRKLWLYLIIATIPAVIFALFFKNIIETSFSSFLFLGIAFIFTGIILLLTKFIRFNGKLNFRSSIVVGLFQMLALFPGVSRSGMTISSGLFSGIDKEKAAKFSFLLFIPLAIGAFIFEFSGFYFNINLLISFIVCLLLSLLFLNLLLWIIKKGKFWIFSFYCFIIGIVSLVFHFL